MTSAFLDKAATRAPWSPDHLVIAVAGMAVGGLVIVLSWYGASGERTLADQVPWITVGILGTVLAAAAQVSYVLFGRRGVGQRAARLIGVAPPSAARPDPTVGEKGPLVTVDGASWYHRADCLLVEDKPTVRLSEPGDLLPCAVCSR